MRDIPCGTRGGVMVYFEKIEVVVVVVVVLVVVLVLVVLVLVVVVLVVVVVVVIKLNFFDKQVVNQLSESFVVNTTRRFGLEYDKNLIFDKVPRPVA